MPDWLEDYMDFTSGIPSPDIFRQWVGISTVSAALERRVWVSTARASLFPNLFVVLVAPPAVGKSVAIDQSVALCQVATSLARQKNQAAGFRMAPIDVSTASMIDALNESTKRYMENNTLIEYASLFIQVGELGVLMPGHDLQFISVLNQVFDSPAMYVQKRRSLKEEINIPKPQINILAGTQPGFLAATLPETAWTMGFTSRLIMVYASVGPVTNLFASSEVDQVRFRALAQGLANMWPNLNGRMDFETAAAHKIQELHTTRIQPEPTHSRLIHYAARRTLHLLKLCMVSAASRNSMVVTLGDVDRAKSWLLHAEALMPDIFRDMAGRSDGQVIEELHIYMWRIWTKEKKPIHQSRLWDFLKTRLPSERIGRVIETATKANVIEDKGLNMYVPIPQHEHGIS
jgi:hypothetical protein